MKISYKKDAKLEGKGSGGVEVRLHSELAFIGSAYVPWANPQTSQRHQADKQVPVKHVPQYQFLTATGSSLETTDSGLPSQDRRDWKTTPCSLLIIIQRQ